MILIIGGYAQGRLNYALKKYKLKESDVFDAEKKDISELNEQKIIYHTESLIQNWLENDKNTIENTELFCSKCKDKILIAQEVGCGLVPITAEHRKLRDAIGKANIIFAEYAETVERVCCGIGMQIKQKKELK